MNDPYLYPGTTTLRNRLGIRHQADLNRVERNLVSQRIIEGVPRGRFDLDHLKAIHRHLFQDLYDWAGEVRTLNISKGGSHFLDHRRIGYGVTEVHRLAAALGTGSTLVGADMAVRLARVVGDLNFVHPFREGNGRTQLQYARLLTERAGLGLDVSRLSGPEWMAASVEAMNARYDAMATCLERALAPASPPAPSQVV